MINGSDIFAEWNKQIIFADKKNVLVFWRYLASVINSNRLFVQTIYRNKFYTVFDPLSEVQIQRFNPKNLIWLMNPIWAISIMFYELSILYFSWELKIKLGISHASPKFTTNALLTNAGAQLEGKVGMSHLPFFENWKNCPDFWGKNVLIVFIYRLNFSVKMLC